MKTTTVGICPVNCGKNGACLPRGDSYWCACANGTILNPKDFSRPSEICNGHEAEKSNPENIGIIYSSEFANVFKPKSEPANPTADTSASLSSLTWILIAATIATVVSFSLAFLLWRCRSKWRGCLITGRTRLGPPAKKTNNTLNPRYASNPNYYSSSHDGNLINILRNLEIAREKIAFIHELGEGCFGKVYKGELKHGDASLTVAVKVLKENASPEAEADFQREVEITSGFYHENILPLLGVVMKDTGPMPWMVFEYMKYGDLTDVLRKNSPHLPAGAQSLCKLDCDSLLWIATQVAAGMLYLSQHHFVHRDLATRNCLVGNNLVVKISDFGMSRDIYTCDYYKIGGSRLLPVRWMAPESIMYGKFTLESDVWSYGVLLWEVFTYAKQPYYGHSNEEAIQFNPTFLDLFQDGSDGELFLNVSWQVVKLIFHGILLTPPHDCAPYICDIMAGCWRTDPGHRFNFSDIHRKLLEHQGTVNESTSLTQSQVIDDDNYLIPKRQGVVTTV